MNDFSLLSQKPLSRRVWDVGQQKFIYLANNNNHNESNNNTHKNNNRNQNNNSNHRNSDQNNHSRQNNNSSQNNSSQNHNQNHNNNTSHTNSDQNNHNNSNNTSSNGSQWPMSNSNSQLQSNNTSNLNNESSQRSKYNSRSNIKNWNPMSDLNDSFYVSNSSNGNQASRTHSTMPKLESKEDRIDLTGGGDHDEQGDFEMNSHIKHDKKQMPVDMSVIKNDPDLVDYFKGTKSLDLLDDPQMATNVSRSQSRKRMQTHNKYRIIGSEEAGKRINIAATRGYETFGNDCGKRGIMYARCDKDILRYLVGLDRNLTLGAAMRLAVGCRNNKDHLKQLVGNVDSRNKHLRKIYSDFSRDVDKTLVEEMNNIFQRGDYTSMGILFEMFEKPSFRQLQHLTSSFSNISDDMTISQLLFSNLGLNLEFGEKERFYEDVCSSDDDAEGSKNQKDKPHYKTTQNSVNMQNIGPFERYIDYIFIDSNIGERFNINKSDFISLLKKCGRNVALFIHEIDIQKCVLSAYEILSSNEPSNIEYLERRMKGLIDNAMKKESNFKAIDELVSIPNSQYYCFDMAYNEREAVARSVVFLTGGNYELAGQCISGQGVGRGVPLKWILECKEYFSKTMSWT